MDDLKKTFFFYYLFNGFVEMSTSNDVFGHVRVTYRFDEQHDTRCWWWWWWCENTGLISYL